MSAKHPWKRFTDHFQIPRTWERISEETRYRSVVSELPVGDSENARAKPLALIVESGMWLQRSIGVDPALGNKLADELSIQADLSNNLYEDSSRERVAAAYLLWPFHSARYYGYIDVAEPERLKSRQALSDIQAILYNNVRGFLDVLRISFNCHTDADLQQFVSDETGRKKWRPAKLIDHPPDLCAVDFLVTHMLQLMRSRPLVRRAIESIQALSVNANADSAAICEAVSKAFKELSVAQMTVFYNPNPIEVKTRDQMPLYELVHETPESDPVPGMLIPFEDNERLKKNFRKLASNIYSIRETKEFPNFSHHRKATIGRVNDPNSTTSFFSDGAITNFFLSTKPPVQTALSDADNSNNGSGNSEGVSLWPLWYKQTLDEFEVDGDFPDWSNHFWWSSIGRDELQRRLFPGPSGQDDLHRNDHMSAYWDDLVASNNNKKFEKRIEIPDKHPTGEPTFGYLMELLLRREQETRTSFFFALAQTFEKESRLYQFVGGTFIGLERPGIPFSRERFEAIAARARGLVMAVAHYTTTHAIKTARWQREQERSNFGKRVRLIASLLRGTDRGPRRGVKPGKTRPSRFRRNGHLLFTCPLSDGRTDHDYIPSERVGWQPSRFQIKSVFDTADHLQEILTPNTQANRLCSDTWKALLYLGGTANRHNKLDRFRNLWQEYHDEDPGARTSNVADRAITCPECFGAALEFLLGEETYKLLSTKIATDESLWLPSRPGIRFLIALCRLVVDIQSQSSPQSTSITRIQFLRDRVMVEFDKPGLLQRLFQKAAVNRKPNTVHTTGIFRLLEDNLIVPLGEQSGDHWIQFLSDPKFASPLKLESENDDRRLLIRWEI